LKEKPGSNQDDNELETIKELLENDEENDVFGNLIP